MEKTAVTALNEHYDKWMASSEVIFDKIGFFNTGYWRGEPASIEIAQINLIETLVGFLQEREGNILDVACGKGASSKYLTKYFRPEEITGINSSQKQLEVCRAIAPECRFACMDAAKMTFDDATFDNILCIDSASHFATRYEFFKEAFRVLKRGGRLAMSDIVNNSYIFDLSPTDLEENFLSSVDAYRELLSKVGFRYLRVEDTSEFAIAAFFRFVRRKLENEPGEMNEARLKKLEIVSAALAEPEICCMVFAIK